MLTTAQFSFIKNRNKIIEKFATNFFEKADHRHIYTDINISD